MKVYSKKQIDQLIEEKIRTLKQECIFAVDGHVKSMVVRKENIQYNDLICRINNMELKLSSFENMLPMTKVPNSKNTNKRKSVVKKLNERMNEKSKRIQKTRP